MKIYIKTKTIKATPAWKLDNGTIIPKDVPMDAELQNCEMQDGYMVIYEDDYTSWSPKDIFEKAYKIAETPLDRMYIEYNDLMDKYNKLVLFLGRKDAEQIAGEMQVALMEEQKIVMKDYLLILRTRIELMKK